MSLDGALNMTGMSLQLLAVFVGFAASDAGRGAQKKFGDWGKSVQPFGPFWLFVFLLVFSVGGLTAVSLWVPPFAELVRWKIPESWPMLIKVVLILGIMLLSLVSLALITGTAYLSEWAIRRLPKSTKEASAFLGILGGVFGLGVILQIIAAATP